MLCRNCVRFEDQAIFGLRVFGVKVQYMYKYIVLSAQIPLKDYYFYIFHSILIKLGMYHHWVNAFQKNIGIRPLGPRDEYSKGLILLQLHYMSNHVSISRPHGPLVIQIETIIKNLNVWISFEVVKYKWFILSQGLQVSKKEKVSPWEIIEGYKNPPPLSWAFFCANKEEKKPLKYDDQHRYGLVL